MSALAYDFEPLLGKHYAWQKAVPQETVPTGIPNLELPRGGLTEIIGPASSGRYSLLVSILAQATNRDECCALIDAEDTFDPIAAAEAGVKLNRLLWVRCTHNAEQALKAADILIQGGGFGIVALDLGETPVPSARRISLTSWFRLRRAVEHTPTVLLALARQSNAKTCASLQLECEPQQAQWTGAPGVSRLLTGLEVRVNAIQKSKQCSSVFMAPAI